MPFLKLPQDFRLYMKLTAGMWACTLVGSTYAFGLLSNELKQEFHFSQGDITTITTISFVLGMCFHFPCGVLYDAAGPRVTTFCGTVAEMLAFLGYALSFAKVIPVTVATLSIYYGLGVMAGGLFDVGTLMTNLFNFPENRGEIVILQKTLEGLGATFLAVFYNGFFQGEYVGYCFFAMSLCVVFGGCGVIFVTLPPKDIISPSSPSLSPENEESTSLQSTKGRHVVIQNFGTTENNNNNDVNDTCGASSCDQYRIYSSQDSAEIPKQQKQQHVQEEQDEEKIELIHQQQQHSGYQREGTSSGSSSKDVEKEVKKECEDRHSAATGGAGEHIIALSHPLQGASSLVCRTAVADMTIRLDNDTTGTLSRSRRTKNTSTEGGCGSVQAADKSRLRVGMVLLTASILFLVFASLLPAYVSLPKGALISLGVVGLMLYLSFIVIPFWKRGKEIKEEGEDKKEFGSRTNCHHSEGEKPCDEEEQVRRFLLVEGRHCTEGIGTTAATGGIDDDSTYQEQDNKIKQNRECSDERNLFQRTNEDNEEDKKEKRIVAYRQYETSFCQTLRRPEYWCMWFTSFGLWGAGCVIVTNCTQIYRAVNLNHYESSTNSMFVAAIGVGSALGRIATGTCERFLSIHDRSFTWVYPGPSIVGAIALIFFLFMPTAGLVLPFFMFGFAYGMSWACSILTVRLMYKKDVGKHYDFFFTSGLISVVLLNRVLFGMLYDKEGREQEHRRSHGNHSFFRDSSCLDAMGGDGLGPSLFTLDNTSLMNNGTNNNNNNSATTTAVHCSGRACISLSLGVVAAVVAATIPTAVYVHYKWRKHSGMR